jgi:sirohydrochlorin ferrochelatase
MTLLLVSHGQPSAADAAEASLALLAQAVQHHLPEVQVRSATLAAPGALAAAVAGIAPGRVYPLFMSGGWFTRILLPKRLAEAGASGWTVLEPMGCDPAIQRLALEIVRENLPATSLILAAHGSGKSPAPAAIATRLAAQLSRTLGLLAEAAFIDQSPRIADTKGHGPDALCLPFFAADGGHVTDDIPAALAEAGFQGRLLPPLGLDPRLPALIAQAARQGHPICTADCRAAH